MAAIDYDFATKDFQTNLENCAQYFWYLPNIFSYIGKKTSIKYL